MSNRHDFDGLNFDWRSRVVLALRDHIVFVPDFAQFQRIVVINVRNGGFVAETAHETARFYGIFFYSGRGVRGLDAGKLDQMREQIDFRLGVQKHGLRRRATAVD